MKRRITKKILRKAEAHLEHSLKGFLVNANNEAYVVRLRKLSSALAYLLGVHLQLDPLWNHKQRWIDDVEWSAVSSSGTTIKGDGKMWWGYRMRTSAALVPIEFQARLQLRSTSRSLGIGYVITFKEEGIRFCIRSRVHRC
jgi:hypothetical protein